jgi:hypothetical protein
MKRHLPAVLAVLVTGLLVYEHFFVRRERNERIAELEAELAALKDKARTDKTLASKSPGRARGTDAAAPVEPVPAAGETPGTSAKQDEKPDALDILMGAGPKEVAARTEARLQLLRDRLKLRQDQEEGLKKLGDAHNAAVLAAFERIRQGKGTPPDMGIMIDWSLGGTPLDMTPLLDAEQEELYTDFGAKEQAGRVEGMVNMELLELQSQGSLHLTPEQKDQVFAALTDIVAEEDAAGAAYYVDDGNFMERIDASLQRRREALQAVLDASQMQSYNRMLEEDRGLIVSMFPGRQ